MNLLMGVHVAAGILALPSGTAAILAGKGGPVHARAGTCFFASMLVLGATASALEPFRTPPGSPAGGVMVCYFVATSWVAARRRDGTTGRFEILACACAIGLAALMAWGAFAGTASTPAGRGPIFALAGLCLVAGLLDLNAILRSRLTPVQRLSRHVWRMCFAFFIATGSFFLGQQDVLPRIARGSPLLFVLAFARSRSWPSGSSASASAKPSAVCGCAPPRRAPRNRKPEPVAMPGPFAPAIGVEQGDKTWLPPLRQEPRRPPQAARARSPFSGSMCCAPPISCS
jgi:hypothetical protein